MKRLNGLSGISGALTLLLLVILVFQSVQVVLIEVRFKDGETSVLNHIRGTNILASFQVKSNTMSNNENLTHRLPTPGRLLDETSVSACLMLMDDNAHLIEWLAYHYHSLPLRRLIVAVDPRSQTSPSSILARWRGMVEITEWSDVDFMPPRLMDAHLQDLARSDLTKLFRQRQEEFYARCMARLKYEGRTWVALVDTDEYIKPNTHSQRHYAYLKHQQTENPSITILDLLKVRKEYSYVANVDGGAEAMVAAAQESQLAQQIDISPCFPMARLTFGVTESDTTDLHNTRIPWGFDPNKFQTLRWRWHAGRSRKSVNKISKSLIDVSRVDSSLFIPTKQVMVHLPIQEYCHGEDDLWLLNSQSLLVVHHYGGTWEQWSRRGISDPRGKRTREAYDRMKYDKQADDTIRPWLAAFIKEVGWWKARRLLQGVGEV